MAANTFIVTTDLSSMDALKYQGILVSENYAQIKSFLEKNLSREHAAIFATPYKAGDGATIDWYCEAKGPVIAWPALSLEKQQEVLTRLKALGADIGALAADLQNSLDAPGVTRGHILAFALRYPSQDNIFLVGEQPVITCWGFIPSSQGVQPEDLMRAGVLTGVTSTPTPQPPAPADSATAELIEVTSEPLKPPLGRPEEKRSINWLGFLLPLFIGLIATFLLLFFLGQMPGCSGTLPGPATEEEPALLPPGAPRVVPGESAPLLLTPQQELALSDEKQREAQLRARLDQLRYELTQRAALCAPEQTAQQPPAPEQLPPPREQAPDNPTPDNQKPPMSDLLPQTPDPLEVKPEIEIKPQIEVKPEEKPVEEQAEPGDPLTIPPDAAENRDLSFLKGCWVSTTDLFNFDSKEPITVQYCFDENGKGTRTVQEKGGSRCAGPLQARFDSAGKLVIDGSSAACNSGGRFVPQRVQCSGRGDSTQCYGKELSDKGLEWKANFRRQ